MGLRQWWKTRRSRPSRAEAKPQVAPSKDDLREFLYLDEVSLRSLLSSLTGDLREGGSEQVSDDLQTEVAGAVKAGNVLTGAEGSISSRFQTTNSSSTQTSRKATVQSWFKQFHEIREIRLIEVAEVNKAADDLAALASTTEKSLLSSSDDLRRGELVEFRVRLSADPVYRLGTMVTEFAGMADDYPEMFEADGVLASLRGVQPVGKVLDRLLVGLIPIRAVAIDYSVVTIEDVKYVAHNDLLHSLDNEREPLQIVGVTEKTGYWKDLRRVLFSEAEVTLLGRISRAGIQASWTPVKLADLFEGTAPDLVEKINAAGRLGTDMPQTPTPITSNENRLGDALRLYAEAILASKEKTLSESEKEALATEITALRSRSGSASDQNSAFAVTRNYVAELTGATIGARRELALREQARMSSGLPLFPALSSATAQPQPSTMEAEEESLIDVEIIAIYW
ncbi:DUF6414 family protein [Microbacterium lacticum]